MSGKYTKLIKQGNLLKKDIFLYKKSSIKNDLLLELSKELN